MMTVLVFEHSDGRHIQITESRKDHLTKPDWFPQGGLHPLHRTTVSEMSDSDWWVGALSDPDWKLVSYPGSEG